VWGESDGDHQTFGTLEPRDVLGAYDFMRARGYAPESMLVIGISTGGEALLEAARDLPRAGALVVDSAPADTSSLILPRVHERLPPSFDPGIIAAAGVLFGLDIELRPIDRVKQLRDRAFLFIVCDADDYVSPQNSDRLRRASSNPESQLVRIHCRKHVSTYKTDRASYLAALSAFTVRQIDERGG
jgi:pimeloyl-ACP methyl ester carboxylesterase